MGKIYDRDRKIAYIEQIEAGKNSVPAAAKQLGVAEATIYNWRNQLRDDRHTVCQAAE